MLFSIVLTITSLFGMKPDVSSLKDAIENDKINQISQIIKGGVSVNSKIDDEGNTPLYYAITKGKWDAVTLLMELGADVNAKNENGNTPLMLALELGEDSLLPEFLKYGAKINQVNNQGNSALIFAAQAHHIMSSAIEKLIRSGAAVNLQNKKGQTALMVAIKDLLNANDSSKNVTIRLLINAGADIDNLRDNNGDTAKDYAAQKGYQLPSGRVSKLKGENWTAYY